MQRGQLIQAHGSWYVRYYEGKVRRAQKLGSLKEYPSVRMIEPLLHKLMEEVNRADDSSCALDIFIEKKYLVWARDHLRPSTADGYTKLYTAYFKGLPEATMRVREFRVADAQRLMDAIAKLRPLSARTIQHIKHFLSGVFNYASTEGLREWNPMTPTRLPKAGKPTRVTKDYTLAEIELILGVLPIALKAAVATAAYAGLRLAELHGLEWSDYDGETIQVQRSVWRGHTSDTKTMKSKAPVRVIPALKRILDAYSDALEALGMHRTRMWPLDLDKTARRVLKPAIAIVGLDWRGWHAFRRGIASNLFELGAEDITVQRALRHSKVTVTREHYIKLRDAKLESAMLKLANAVDGVANA